MANYDAEESQLDKRAKSEFLVYFGIAANEAITPALEEFVATFTNQGYATSYESSVDEHNNPVFTVFLIPQKKNSPQSDMDGALAYHIVGDANNSKIKYLAQIASANQAFDEDVASLQSLTKEDLDSRLLAWANSVLI